MLDSWKRLQGVLAPALAPDPAHDYLLYSLEAKITDKEGKRCYVSYNIYERQLIISNVVAKWTDRFYVVSGSQHYFCYNIVVTEEELLEDATKELLEMGFTIEEYDKELV